MYHKWRFLTTYALYHLWPFNMTTWPFLEAHICCETLLLMPKFTFFQVQCYGLSILDLKHTLSDIAVGQLIWFGSQIWAFYMKVSLLRFVSKQREWMDEWKGWILRLSSTTCGPSTDSLTQSTWPTFMEKLPESGKITNLWIKFFFFGHRGDIYFWPN